MRMIFLLCLISVASLSAQEPPVTVQPVATPVVAPATAPSVPPVVATAPAPAALLPIVHAPVTSTYFLLGLWPDTLARFDPVTDTIVKQMKFRNGVQHGLQLSHDRKTLMAITGQRGTIEVIDLAKMEVVEEHLIKKDGWILRVRRVMECPGGKQWYLQYERVEKKVDHFVIHEMQWALYKVEEKELGEGMKELPEGIRRGASISPDGTKWHVFSQDLIVVDPVTLKEDARIELSKPLYTGMGPLNLGGEDFYENRNPDAYRMLYSMTDPVKKNRRIAGLIDLDMKGMKIANMVEWGAGPSGGFGLHMSADHTRAFGQGGGRGGSGGRGDGAESEMTIACWSLVDGKKLGEGTLKVRTALSISALSHDAKKLYLTGRGHDVWVVSDEFKLLKTLELPGEVAEFIEVRE
ncbi:MAG: hypothetical protein EXS14_08565 [Planctomycetes bacterium]|nr:hypothetical protein [Planctomycetota bacterium]